MRRTTLENAPSGLLQQHLVHTSMLMDEQKIDEVSGPRRAATLVGPRVGVQLLGDLPLQRHQQDLDRAEPEFGQKSWSARGLSIPTIGRGNGDVHLEWLEWPSREGAVQLVPYGETNTRFPEFFTADESEAEVVANVLNSCTLEIRTRRFGAVHVIRVQIDRCTCAAAEPGLESEPSLEGPPIRCNSRQAHQQAFQRGLPPDDVRRHAEAMGMFAQLDFDCGTKGSGSGVFTHVRRPP